MNGRLFLVLCLLLLLSCLSYTRFSQPEPKASDSFPVHNVSTGLNYTTIQEAINANETLNGHTIFVEKGEYHENVVVNKSLTLAGESMETTIIDGSGIGNVVQVTADDVTFVGFTIRNSNSWPEPARSGILLENVKSCNISGNRIESNDNGVMSSNSVNICLTNNKVERNSNGFIFYSLSKSIICGNNFTANIIGIELNGSFNNTIYENNIAANSFSLELYYSSENQIYGNRVENNSLGIVVGGSSGDTVFKNDVVKNGGPGIQLVSSSHDNVVCGNNVTANGGAVIIEDSSNNTVCGNDMADNSWSGIHLWNATNNSIFENNFLRNEPGAYSYISFNNVIFHNNFIGNSPEVLYSVNVWDQGYPSGGNYYDNYNGADLKSGPYQNETGSDGIGDTTFAISEANVDNYPLMGMFSDFTATPECSVQTICNSSISDFQFNGTAIRFNVSGENGTTGFCRICIPTALIKPGYIISVNGTDVQYKLLPNSNSTQSYLYFAYHQSTQEVIIATPEFPFFLILPLFIVATLLSATIFRARRNSTQGVR